MKRKASSRDILEGIKSIEKLMKLNQAKLILLKKSLKVHGYT